MKGVILAGGTGSRLYPLTTSLNKHLLPIYDKPMIYYPLATLLMAGCDDIAVVTTPNSEGMIRNLLGDGRSLGIQITYFQQERPGGIAHALETTVDWSASEAQWVILGDNIFFGQGVGTSLGKLDDPKEYCVCFSVKTSEPEKFGIVELSNGVPTRIIEKPKPGQTESNLALTGLYRLPAGWEAGLKQIKVSDRGEMEISSLLSHYLKKSKLTVRKIPRGTIWMDAGTTASLNSISQLVASLQDTTGQNFGSPEEVAMNVGLISPEELRATVEEMPPSLYKRYLESIFEER